MASTAYSQTPISKTILTEAGDTLKCYNRPLVEHFALHVLKAQRQEVLIGQLEADKEVLRETIDETTGKFHDSQNAVQDAISLYNTEQDDHQLTKSELDTEKSKVKSLTWQKRGLIIITVIISTIAISK